MNAPASSLADRVSTRVYSGHILNTGWMKSEPVFVTAEGEIHLDQQTLKPHQDSILCARFDGARLLTGGDDGRVVETKTDGTLSVIAHEKGRWIDALAAGPDGAVAYSAGKRVVARDGKGGVKTLDLPSSVQGLAFMPKGYRLGIAHLDGASLWFPNMAAEPEKLTWKGSHIDVTPSPDGRFIVTSMQENQLHGWRLNDKGHMRMSGYPAKVRSFAWSHDGLWLATSGAEAAIVWPFAKDGPMGKAPRECGVRPARVSSVAFHPKALVLAIGYADGWVILVRFTDNSELLVRAGGDGAPVSCLAWNANGTRLSFGTESGAAGLLDLPV